MACHLYEYYEHALDKAIYCDPSSGPVLSNRPVVMYHSESAPSVQNAVSSCLSDPDGVVHMECLLHNTLVWGYIAKTLGVIHGEYHKHLNNTSRNADMLAGITCQQRQPCCTLQRNCVKSFVQKLLLTIAPTLCATLKCYCITSMSHKMTKLTFLVLMCVAHCVLQNVLIDRLNFINMCLWRLE